MFTLAEGISLICIISGFVFVIVGFILYFKHDAVHAGFISSIFGGMLITLSLFTVVPPQNEQCHEKEISNYNEKLISLNKLTSSHNKIKCEFKKVTYKETIAKEKLPRTLEEFNDDYLNNLKTICKKAFNQENLPATIEYNYEYSNNNTVSANFVVSIEKH